MNTNIINSPLKSCIIWMEKLKKEKKTREKREKYLIINCLVYRIASNEPNSTLDLTNNNYDYYYY